MAVTPSTARAPAQIHTHKGLAITALVLGITAFCIGWVPFFGAVIGIAGVIFGIIALIKRQHKVMSIIGLVLSAIAVISSVLFTFFWANVINNAQENARNTSGRSERQYTSDSPLTSFDRGETANFYDIQVKATTIEKNWQPDNEYSKASDGKQFVRVSLQIKNISDDNVSVSPYKFKVSEDGLVRSPRTISNTQNKLETVELKPGAEIAGDIIYEVRETNDLELEYETYRSRPYEKLSFSLEL